MQHAKTSPLNTVKFSSDSDSDLLHKKDTPECHTMSRSRMMRMTPGRARRFTPYTKTPATRNLRSVKRTGAAGVGAIARTPLSDKQAALAQPLQDLVGRTWHVHRVSPLYKFSHKSTDLRQYGRLLSGALQAECARGIAVDTTEDQANMATISLYKGLARTDGEAEAIQIQLKQKAKQGGGESRVVGLAVLCSVDVSEESVQHVAAGFTLLPVLIYRGPVGLSRILTQWLMTMFDCVIHPVIFTPVHMSWMVAMWAGSILTDHKGKTVQLQYKVSVDGLDHITLDIDPKDCKTLWNHIHTNAEERFHQHEVVTFIKALEEHFYRHFKIQLSMLPLCKVGTSVACVGSQGKLKMFSTEFLHQVLGHLTEVIMETSSCSV